MVANSRPTPDAILALVRVLRHADRLLTEAEALRAARDTLQQYLDPEPPADRPEEARHAE
jgi:hypothetical protein